MGFPGGVQQRHRFQFGGYRPRSSFTSAPTESILSHRSPAVAGGPYRLTALDPSRVFTTSLKEGGKWFT